MKTYTLPVIGLMTLGASAFAAAAPSTGNSLPARDNFSACKWLGDRFKWFNSERDHKNPYIQEFNVSLRMQYGLDWIDPNGEGRVMGEKEGNGRRFNDEWRRFRAGFNMKFLNNFKINNVWNIGGMDGLESYNAKTNTWDTSDLTYSLYELNLEYKGDPITYAIGKIKPRITGEYRTSSSAILTIERSMLVNQLRPETNYGFQVNNSDKKDKLGWAAGVWLNGNGGTGTGTFNNRIEPAFNSRDNCFITGTLSYDTSNDVFRCRGWIMPITSPTGATTHKTRRMKSSPATALNPNTGHRRQGRGGADLGRLWDFSLMTEVMAGFNVIGMKQLKTSSA
ncbi:MAG: porin [Akkermansia sp.]